MIETRLSVDATGRTTPISSRRTPVRSVFVDTLPGQQADNLGFTPLGGYYQVLRRSMGLRTDELERIDAINGQLPSVDGIHVVYLGGSTHSSNDGFPWQRRLRTWVRRVIDTGTPFMGMCYGLQEALQAYNAGVEKNPRGRHFGVARLQQTADGIGDPILDGLSPTEPLAVYVSHTESVVPDTLPTKSRLLATNPDFPVQLVALAHNAYAAQFHPEFVPEVMYGIAASRTEAFFREGYVGTAEELDILRAEIGRESKTVLATGRTILGNFRGIAEDHIRGTK